MSTDRLPLWMILCLLLAIACQPKLYPIFAEQQQLYYSDSWKKLGEYPSTRGRNDDLYFFTPQRGFVINSQGHLYLTEDGGQHWTSKFRKERTFFRCLTFKDSLNGWLGTLGPDDSSLRSEDEISMYETSDGGESWNPTTFQGPYPKGLCGLQTVSDQVIVGCGRVRGPSFFIKTVDGGKTWNSYDYNHLAGSLIAPHFYDENHGILIGGTTQDKKNCRSLVLETFDGGNTWDTIYVSSQKGEYCWKVSFPSKNRGFISIQRNVKNGRFYYLKTEDGGKSWTEEEYTEGYYYVQGVGFINEQVGWLGGSGKWTMETRNGGKTWRRMADVGRGFNKFQFFGDSLAYGVGYGVYKMQKLKAYPSAMLNTFHSNGRIQSALQYQDGRKSGPATYYDQAEQVISKGRLKNNLRQGTWHFYRPNGQLLEKVTYKNGVAQLEDTVLQQYAGVYEIQPGVTRTITYQKGQLYSLHSQAKTPKKIFPISTTEFVFEFNWNNRVEFVRNPQGEVTHHIMKKRSGEREARRIE